MTSDQLPVVRSRGGIARRESAARTGPARNAAPPRADAGSRSASRPGGRTVAGFVGPFFALFAFAFVAPAGYAVYQSLFETKHLGFGPAQTVFAGLGNYAKALGDAGYRHSFVVILLYCACFVPLMLAVSLALALTLDSSLARARRWVQTALFMPHAVPGVIAAMVWVYLYAPGISPVVSALRGGGVPFDIVHTPGALAGMVNLGLWEGIGYNGIIFYAALQAVPKEILEAARLDGAGEIRTAVSVKLPSITGMVGVNGLFAIIGTLQLFAEPMFLSQSTPAITPSWTPLMYIYNAAFNRLDYGAAAAASILLALFTGAISYAAMYLVSRRRTA